MDSVFISTSVSSVIALTEYSSSSKGSVLIMMSSLSSLSWSVTSEIKFIECSILIHIASRPENVCGTKNILMNAVCFLLTYFF